MPMGMVVAALRNEESAHSFVSIPTVWSFRTNESELPLSIEPAQHEIQITFKVLYGTNIVQLR